MLKKSHNLGGGLIHLYGKSSDSFPILKISQLYYMNQVIQITKISL